MAAKKTQGKTQTRREFYKNRLAKKHEELAAIEDQLGGTLSKRDELKLDREAEALLEQIEKLYVKLSEIDAKENNSNIRHLNLDKSFQKIDYSQAKKIAQSINKELGDNSGVIFIFLQRSTKQKGNYCLNEFLDVIIRDRKAGEDISGDFRPYQIDLGSSISEFNELEFSKRLASYLDNNHTEESLKYCIKKLCSSLQGGSIIFIQIKNWDSVLEQEAFLAWFMKNFWQNVIEELKPVFKEYSKIRFIVALVAKSKVFSNCCSLEYFSGQTKIDHRKIIELPVPDWTVEDIRRWLINNLGLSKPQSLQMAKQIHRESEGTPDTICSILERIFKEKTTKVC